MSGTPAPADVSQLLQVDEVCDRFEAAWAAGQRSRVEDYGGATRARARWARARELILLEVHYRRQTGDDCRPEEYHSRFPTLDLAWLAGALAGIGRHAARLSTPAPLRTEEGK